MLKDGYERPDQNFSVSVCISRVSVIVLLGNRETPKRKKIPHKRPHVHTSIHEYVSKNTHTPTQTLRGWRNISNLC